MRKHLVLAITALAVSLLATTSQAGFIISVAQSGANVVMSYTGSFTFVGSGAIAPHNPSGWVQDNEFYHISNLPNSTETQYLGSRTPLVLFPNWTPSGMSGRLVATSVTGDKLAFIDDGRVVTAERSALNSNWDLTANTYSASGTMTFINRNISDFINVGETRDLNWTQAGQGFVQGNTIRVVGVPEPGSLAVVSGLVAGLSVLSRRRRHG